jgi:hypothetical protein
MHYPATNRAYTYAAIRIVAGIAPSAVEAEMSAQSQEQLFSRIEHGSVVIAPLPKVKRSA